MSVIQRIRDKGAWIIFAIIAIALISFILQDGLSRRGSLFTNTTTVGKVNGKSIEREDFDNMLKLYSRGGNKEQMVQQVWNMEVNNILMEQEYEKLGLVCTEKELSEAMFGENSPLKREFTDPQTGVFKADEARNAFAQLKKSKNIEQQNQVYEGYIKPTIQTTLQTKYQNLLTQSAYAPKWLIEKTQSDNNTVAGGSYVYVPYSTIADSTVKVSDEEILTFAKKHKKEYEKDEESRAVSYVTFDIQPSGADTQALKTKLETYKSDFVAIADSKKFLAKNASEMSYYESHISKAEIKQAVKDSIFALQQGQVYGPYLDGANMVLAKLVEVKQWPDSAKVRHILVATKRQDPQTGQMMMVRDDSAARKRMDTVEMLVKGGAKFDSVCAKFSDDGNKDKGGVYDFFPTGRMVASFNEFSFGKPVGSTGVVETEYGLHYVEVLGQKGSAPAYQVAYLAKPIQISNETASAISSAAAQFASSSKTVKEAEENAKKINKTLSQANEVKENDVYVNGIGNSRSFVKWVYEHKAGDVTEQPIEVNNGANASKLVVAIVTSISKPGIPAASVIRAQVEPLVRNEKKAKQIIDSKFKGATLEAISTTAGAPVQRADSLTFNNPFVPGVGNDTKFVGLVFNKNMKGKVSQPVAGSSGVFSVKPEYTAPRANVTETIENLKQSLVQGQKMAAYRSAEALKKAAKIKDYRSNFY